MTILAFIYTSCRHRYSFTSLNPRQSLNLLAGWLSTYGIRMHGFFCMFIDTNRSQYPPSVKREREREIVEELDSLFNP